WFGELRTRPTGSLVSDRRGMTTAYALMNLQERGAMLIGPGVEVYEGMIVGENARADEMDVNPTKEKQLTNISSARAFSPTILDRRAAYAPDRQLGVRPARDDDRLRADEPAGAGRDADRPRRRGL